MRTFGFAVSSLIIMTCGLVMSEEKNVEVKPFEAPGILKQVDELFQLPKSDSKPGVIKRDSNATFELAKRVFVTADGVYAFLETPENMLALANLKPNTPVSISGQLLTTGQLLSIDTVTVLREAPAIDLKPYREETGKLVTLRGKNLCQCGLDVSGLPHSCKLGHLHHLQTNDGTIYNYLPIGRGSETYLGQGSHFQPLEVKALLFPGHLILVETAKLTK